ncbi:CRISPR system precrRNA processing endoribonuclease RAMP protein Cas6 [Geobacter sp.]|uniref:CRISPR system precrRNA processing endoribonuclease RAMP protein Cas6 n=1 Tax=Geobacter sp. TaxID=46610 RepID=UPI002626B829|nr:CRISPR system precrRNA processing endoribonuclease RAMP protein Cas6 [Geobacter sp.]
MDLTFVKLVIGTRLECDVKDSWMLFRSRETFQEVFRSVAECRKGGCEGCGEKECPYRAIFSQALSSDPAAVRRHQKPPLPFAFRFPVLPAAPNKGERFDVGLTLVGSAVMHGNLFLKALENWFEGNGAGSPIARIERVESEGYFGERFPWSYDGEAVPLLLSASGLSDTGMIGDRIALTLVTPLKIMAQGRPLRFFSFPRFFRSLMRRVTSLAAIYGEGDVEGDFRWLSSECEEVSLSGVGMKWVDWRGGTIGGVVGEAQVSGVREEFLPFLLLGQYLNLGKGASFGLGQFSVRPVAS